MLDLEAAALDRKDATNVTFEDLKDVLTGVIASANAEIQQASQQDLERHWHFSWNSSASLESNLYQFHKMLSLYGSICRRWEEAHNGHCCVVERVRDTYLMPKIREFARQLGALPSTPTTVSEQPPGSQS